MCVFTSISGLLLAASLICLFPKYTGIFFNLIKFFITYQKNKKKRILDIECINLCLGFIEDGCNLIHSSLSLLVVLCESDSHITYLY